MAALRPKSGRSPGDETALKRPFAQCGDAASPISWRAMIRLIIANDVEFTSECTPACPPSKQLQCLVIPRGADLAVRGSGTGRLQTVLPSLGIALRWRRSTRFIGSFRLIAETG